MSTPITVDAELEDSMTRMRSLSVVLTLVLVASIAMLTVTAQSVHAKTSVPFKGVFEGTFEINPANLHLHFSGEGPASHLGDSGIVGDSQLVPAGPCFEIATDAVTLSAANGDQLFLTNSGQDCFDAAGNIVGNATFTITGGTGRFDGASGTGTTQVVATPDQTGLAGSFILLFSGRISY
jgi:hypothetical protein